jgi:hypothetical protein
MEWLRHYERFWNGKLGALAAILEAEDAVKPKRAAAQTLAKPRRKK